MRVLKQQRKATLWWPSQDLVGEACSALRPAARQYLAAVSIGHSFSDPLPLFSVELLGLVGSQHKKNLLSGTNLCSLPLYRKKIPSVNPFIETLFPHGATHTGARLSIKQQTYHTTCMDTFIPCEKRLHSNIVIIS